MTGWKDERMNEWITEWENELGWINEWKIKWIKEWMKG